MDWPNLVTDGTYDLPETLKRSTPTSLLALLNTSSNRFSKSQPCLQNFDEKLVTPLIWWETGERIGANLLPLFCFIKFKLDKKIWWVFGDALTRSQYNFSMHETWTTTEYWEKKKKTNTETDICLLVRIGIFRQKILADGRPLTKGFDDWDLPDKNESLQRERFRFSILTF